MRLGGVFPVAFACFLLVGLASYGQSQQNPTRFELGMNSTAFLAQFFSFGDSSIVAFDPYAIQFKSLMRGKGGVRIGFGASQLKQKKGVDTQEEIGQHLSRVVLRVGYERRINVGKRWQTFFGVDLHYGFLHQRSVSNGGNGEQYGFNGIKHSGGVGPVMGIQFFPAKRISFGTELTARVWYANTDFYSGRVISDGSIPSLLYSAEEVGISFDLPISIFVNISFGKEFRSSNNQHNSK